MNLLQLVVAIEGCIATAFCFGLFVFFVRSKYQIGRAVGYDKLAEGFLSAMTLCFTFVAHGIWDLRLHDGTVVLMRCLMFSASLACSIHLTLATVRVMRKKDLMNSCKT